MKEIIQQNLDASRVTMEEVRMLFEGVPERGSDRRLNDLEPKLERRIRARRAA